MAGGKPGFVLSLRPRRYKTTKQQNTMREAAKSCGIEKGITRKKLVKAMTECLPQYFAKKREESQSTLPSSLSQSGDK